MAHLLASSPFFRGQVFIMQPALQQIKTRGTMLRGASSAATRCVPRDKQGLLVLRFSRIWGCRTHACKLLQNTPNASKSFSYLTCWPQLELSNTLKSVTSIPPTQLSIPSSDSGPCHVTAKRNEPPNRVTTLAPVLLEGQQRARKSPLCVLANIQL